MERILIKDTMNNIGKTAQLAGWVNVRRDHGKLIFIDLRDRSGIVQMVITPETGKARKIAETVRQEWVIEAVGLVSERPDKMKNPALETGGVEIKVAELKVLSPAETPLIDVFGKGDDIGEEMRLKYRYLDLRRPRLQKNLKNRHKIIKFIRDFLAKKDFTEIETPILTKSTPEGARDYVVPSRLHPGKFYALPQSPQQYKQLLMVSGFEQYFQIARCFRDEDTRGDRQPEFTQLDLEMSFIDQEKILSLTEELFLNLVKTLYPAKKIRLTEEGKIPRITYKEAMEKYGTDKPDARSDKENLDELAFLFVVDFPMFEWKEKERRWDAVHHPFTMPKVETVEEFWNLFKKDPASIAAYQYDFVLNGYEIGGGSIRTHNPELLMAVFEAMGNKPEAIKKQFGHLLEAFKYGVPPHGGIAPGIDRLAMILENEPNIREVIAFPKTGDGRDLMMDAPSEISKEQLRELNVKIGTKRKE